MVSGVLLLFVMRFVGSMIFGFGIVGEFCIPMTWSLLYSMKLIMVPVSVSAVLAVTTGYPIPGVMNR